MGSPVLLGWKELVTAALSGALLSLAFPGFDAPSLLAWLALTPLCALTFVPRRRRDMVKLFAAFGAGFYLSLLYWFLAMHPLTWLGFSEGASLAIVCGAWLAASGLLVTQLAALGLIFGGMTRHLSKPGAWHVAALAAAWVSLEWLTSLGTFGFTWGNLALTQVAGRVFVQAADLVGPFPIAGVLVAVNGLLALAVVPAVVGAPDRQAWRPVTAALLLVCALGGYGVWQTTRPIPSGTFSVSIVQGNIAGSDKWTRERGAIHRMADKYLGLSSEQPNSNLVLWPETAMPEFLRNNPTLLERLRAAAVREGRAYMFGTLDWEGERESLKLYNAVTAIDGTGRLLGFDYKRHLVPYGEYVPARDWMPAFLMSMNIVGHDYYPGQVPHLFEFPFGKVGAGVCYDGIFPDAMRPVVQGGAQVLAIVTNDAWYKDTAAPRVLLAHAALRAIESRRWVLRAANTGISAVIDPTGRVASQTPVFVDAALTAQAGIRDDITPYVRFGDWLSALCTLWVLGALGVGWIRTRKT